MLILSADTNDQSNLITILLYLILVLYLMLQMLTSARYQAHVIMRFAITLREVIIAPNVLVKQCMTLQQ